jgi:hypothetical protein
LTKAQVQLLDDPEVQGQTEPLGREAVQLYDGEDLTIKAIAERTSGRLENNGKGFANFYNPARAVLDARWATTMAGKIII